MWDIIFFFFFFSDETAGKGLSRRGEAPGKHVLTLGKVVQRWHTPSVPQISNAQKDSCHQGGHPTGTKPVLKRTAQKAEELSRAQIHCSVSSRVSHCHASGFLSVHFSASNCSLVDMMGSND